jgi:phenylalanyl-tRNA synthetase beta chain
MKFSENWLRTFVDPPLKTPALADALTFSGIEVEDVSPAAARFDQVVVGEVVAVEKHPDAERLSLCQVNVGVAPLTIVCGAPNVAVGMKVPTALVGAKLPGMEIKAARVRGIESHGMLCSAQELGLSDDAAGLMSLPADATVGMSVRELLDLDDYVLTTKPTPNRGDCLSLLGMAREVAAVTGSPLRAPATTAIDVTIADELEVVVEAADACPRYCGRLVKGVDPSARTPRWMSARLERSGIRAISAIVDITNYVMLELGLPLHAFDAATLQGGIHVRYAREHETLELLNGERPKLDARYLVIADEARAVALAGIMGGAATAVTDATRDIFLESAFFSPDVIAGKSRVLGFGSDASFRFERGVDFDQTPRALERATELVIQICGGRAGPVTEARAALPARAPVALRLERATRVLGVELTSAGVGEILRRLGFAFAARGNVFTVTPPSYRFDIEREEDLIEEVARIHGYDRIPAAAPVAPATMLPTAEAVRNRASVRRLVAARDYHEVVTYSFIDPQWEQDFCANAHPVVLANPIASQMSTMRSSLMPGLVDVVAFNVRHKQSRIRVFEIGRVFRKAGDDYAQPVRVAGAAYGDVLAEQWGSPARRVDFYDVKGDLEALYAPREPVFEAAEHPALHPGKSGRLRIGTQTVGWIGELHPRWQQKYDLPLAPILFEVQFNALAAGVLPAYEEIAKFPPVRRDLAALFDENVAHDAILSELKAQASPIVTRVELFDVYRGKDLEKGKKSLAFRVLLQDTRKTLTDAEVESAVSRLREVLRQRFDAKLR